MVLELCSYFLLQDFFRHLPHWIQQHTAMNDAGNFLIETCDETISRDLKQQLLLLNGRWRELFMQVKQVGDFALVTFKYLLFHVHASKTDYPVLVSTIGQLSKVPNCSSVFKLEITP